MKLIRIFDPEKMVLISFKFTVSLKICVFHVLLIIISILCRVTLLLLVQNSVIVIKLFFFLM